MPNLIAHDIFSKDVLNHIKQPYKNIILNHQEEYRIGANGPDFLFFYDIFPIWKKQDPSIPKLGSGLHRHNINLFYKEAIQIYYDTKESPLKEAMASYLIGHFLHWRFDSIMHPYVVYRTGFKEENSTIYHHRFESMMDTILLKEKLNKTLKTFNTPSICKRSKYSSDAISNYYIKCIKSCLETDIDKNIIDKSLKDWEKVQKVLYDPTGFKFKLFQFFENCFKKKWLFTSSMVLLEEDLAHDIMNRNKEIWYHPCTNEKHNESVLELYDLALTSAIKGIELLTYAMETNNSVEILKFIDNVTYNNGTNKSQNRKYKDVIYEKKMEF